ncbi:hypothetical protein Ciccas_014378, partial [Cichlidogyrus casuarinus]
MLTYELRRRRQDQSLELRKLKKEEQLQKRRNLDSVDVENDDTKENVCDDFDGIVKRMQNPDATVRFAAVQLCRKTLSRARNPPIEEFFSRNA